MSTTTRTWLDMSLRQLVAESYLHTVSLSDLDQVAQALELGANSPSPEERLESDHGISGADGDLAFAGFAMAQLAAMEDYYAWLRADPARLPPEATLYVTGYSLGGHLATVFTEIHGAEVAHARKRRDPRRDAPCMLGFGGV